MAKNSDLAFIQSTKYEGFILRIKSESMKKKRMLPLIKVIIALIVIWGLSTLFVEVVGSEGISIFGKSSNPNKALIVYNPDPFYNLDEQVCESFAKGLSEKNWHVKVMTVSSAWKVNKKDFTLYTFCANTYNFAPDWALSHYIKKHKGLEGKPVVAITLGSGSTKRSQGLLEKKIKNKNAQLLNSKAYWLMRPNDESQIDSSNVKLAVKMAYKLGLETALQLEELYPHQD